MGGPIGSPTVLRRLARHQEPGLRPHAPEAHRLPGCRWLRPLRGGGRQAPFPRTAPFRTPGSPAPPTGPCGTILRSGCSAHTGIIRWDGGSRTTGVALGLQNRWGARASPVGSIPTCSRQPCASRVCAGQASRRRRGGCERCSRRVRGPESNHQPSGLSRPPGGGWFTTGDLPRTRAVVTPNPTAIVCSCGGTPLSASTWGSLDSEVQTHVQRGQPAPFQDGTVDFLPRTRPDPSAVSAK